MIEDLKKGVENPAGGFWEDMYSVFVESTDGLPAKSRLPLFIAFAVDRAFELVSEALIEEFGKERLNNRPAAFFDAAKITEQILVEAHRRNVQNIFNTLNGDSK